MYQSSGALAPTRDLNRSEPKMLVLSRKLGESIVIDGEIRVTLVKIDRNQVRVGIEAPRSVSIYREELTRDPAEPVDREALLES